MSANRRNFLTASIAGCTATAINARAFTVQPSPVVRIRQNALLLAADDPIFHQYANAVRLMHELDADDLRSWRKQAEIHPNHCAHGTDHFLPWHRHYLNQFEKICGQLIGDASFALPYWDWSTAGGKIPDAFFEMDELKVTFWNEIGTGAFPNWGAVNSRGVRGMIKGQRAQDDPVRGDHFTAERINLIKNSPDYSLLWQQLEGSPHNTGHVIVGLVPGPPPLGHMIDGLSPLDPLFWLHHCNIDRIWAEWQLAGNSTPPFGTTYDDHFCDAHGNSIDVEADVAIDFEAMGFNYDTVARFGGPREFLAITGVEASTALMASAVAPVQERTLGSAQVSRPIPLNAPFSQELSIRQLASTLAETQVVRVNALPPLTSKNVPDEVGPEAVAGFGSTRQLRRHVFAVIRNARATSEAPPSVSVFLNCPYLTVDTPYTDPHYAGGFSFFGHIGQEHENHDHLGRDFIVDITDALERLGAANAENLRVQLVPVVSGETAQPQASVIADAISIVAY